MGWWDGLWTLHWGWRVSLLHPSASPRLRRVDGLGFRQAHGDCGYAAGPWRRAGRGAQARGLNTQPIPTRRRPLGCRRPGGARPIWTGNLAVQLISKLFSLLESQFSPLNWGDDIKGGGEDRGGVRSFICTGAGTASPSAPWACMAGPWARQTPTASHGKLIQSLQVRSDGRRLASLFCR